MENPRDKKNLLNQVKLLKNHHNQTMEYMSAIELLLVDDNNGKSKDSSLFLDFQNLNRKLSEVDTEINRITNNI